MLEDERKRIDIIIEKDKIPMPKKDLWGRQWYYPLKGWETTGWMGHNPDYCSHPSSVKLGTKYYQCLSCHAFTLV